MMWNRSADISAGTRRPPAGTTTFTPKTVPSRTATGRSPQDRDRAGGGLADDHRRGPEPRKAAPGRPGHPPPAQPGHGRLDAHPPYPDASGLRLAPACFSAAVARPASICGEVAQGGHDLRPGPAGSHAVIPVIRSERGTAFDAHM